MKRNRIKVLSLILALLMLFGLVSGALATVPDEPDPMLICTRRHPDKTGDGALLYDYLAGNLMRLTECEETFNFLYDGMPVNFPPSDVPYRPEQIAVLMLGVAPRTWAELAYTRPTPPEAVGYVYGSTVGSVFSRVWNRLTGTIAPLSALPESGHVTNHGYVSVGQTSGGRYSITIDGVQIPAFCNNRNIPGPATGASHRIMGFDDPQIIRALYFGWGGPASIFDPGQTAEGVLATTIVTSHISTGTANPATHGLQGARTLWAIVQNPEQYPIQHNVQGIFIDVLAAGAQNLVALRVLPEPTIDHGYLQLTKTADTNNVSDIQFRITGNGVDMTVTTGADGLTPVTRLPLGTFTVTEINVPAGYIAPPPQTVTITAEHTATAPAQLTFHNRQDCGELRIIKTSESGVVAGIQFRVTGNDIDQTVTTGADGTISIPALQAGTYTVTEINLGPQYQPQPPQTVTVREGETATVTFHNRLSTGGLRIVKTSESGIVAGIQFRITGDGVDQTVTTGADGSITVPGLQPGTFTVTEINLGSQYEPQPPQTVTVIENQTATVSFNNTLRPGELRIVKTSESGVIAGIQFRVTGQGVNQAVTTGADGSITIPNLKPGVYVVSEVNLGSEYVPQPPQTVTVRPNETTTVTFYNRLLHGHVEGIKVGEDAGTFADANGLAGAVIGLFPYGTTEFTSETALETVTTGVNGAFAFNDLLYGRYLIRELAPPTGYVLNDTAFPVYINQDGQRIEVRIENRLIRGDVAGIKVGEDTDSMLEGVFADADGLAGALIGLFAPDEEHFTTDTALATIITDEYGRFAFRDLPFGDYLIREIAPPEGYVLNETVFPVTIAEDDTAIEIAIENTLIRGRVDGIKTGETTEGSLAGLFADREGLAGATIGLFGLAELGYALPEAPDSDEDDEENYRDEDDSESEPLPTSEAEDDEDYYPNGEEEDEEESEPEPEQSVISIAGIPLEDFKFTTENAVQTAITAEDGSFSFADVIFGTYVVREIYAPEGYVLNERLFVVIIAEDGKVVEVEIENVLIRGNIEGLKVGEDTDAPFEGMFVDGEGLAGALIGLFHGDTEEFTEEVAIETARTDEYGYFAFRDLPFGAYIVREIAPPVGYVLNETAFPVTVTEDGAVIEIAIENTLIRGRIDGIKVCSTTGYPLEGATFGLFASDETTFSTDTALLTSTSGEDGIFGFEDLPFGTYLVRELVAPEGYLLSDETFEVEIGYDGQIVDIRAENEPEPEVPGDPEDKPEDDPKEPTPTPTPTPTPAPTPAPSRPSATAPKTGDDTSLPWLTLVLSGLGAVAIGVTLAVRYAKKKKSQ